MTDVENRTQIAQIPAFGDRYESIELIGKGGMGAVYKVTDKSSGQIIALKILRPELASDKAAVKRFEQEVNATIELKHPNLVNVHYLSQTTDGIPFLAMNYIKGEGLDEVIKFDRFMPTERALNIFAQTAAALAHAHSKNIIHRDMKPSNILISQNSDGREHINIVDFGIAKVLAPNIQQTQLTQTGELFGSPLYMSPEQCSGSLVDLRSDIYSFGCVMYEVVCGKPPFLEENPFQVMLKQVQEEPVPLHSVNPSVSIHKDLEYVVMRCLQKEPGDRYQTVNALIEDLKQMQARKRIKRKIQKNSRKTKRLINFTVILLLSFMVSWGIFAVLTYFTGNGNANGTVSTPH
jgi:serine/threonine protein kinase